MPVIKVYRARIDIGEKISGLVFSYEPMIELDEHATGQSVTVSEKDRFYIETPPGFELVTIKNRLYVRDPLEGDNVYMRAARLVSRLWQNHPGFEIISSTEYEALDRDDSE